MADLPLLMLFRHAKAAKDVDGPDHDRPLTRRGQRQSAAVGRWLADQGLLPDAVWCSSAVRARQTWEGAAAELPSTPAVSYRPDLYDAGVGDALEMLHTAPESVRRLMVVGHNPTIEDLAEMLIGAHRHFPTGGLAVLDCEQPWPTLASATVRDFVDPGQL
jgi:phosphohistidine phosphatase